MSRPLALTQPLFLRAATLALSMSLVFPGAALALDSGDGMPPESSVDNVAESHAAEPFNMQKGVAKKTRIEVEPDLQVLPDPWTGFADVVAEVENAGGPEKVWYVADGWLNYIVGEGLMSGYASNGCFGSYDSITRGQVAVILYRAECAKNPALVDRYGSTTDPTRYAWLAAFRDEEASVYYTAAINWAKDAGILTGDTSTGCATVRPNDPVARQELCLMLARYANGGEVPSVELDPAKAESIKGMEQIADWARDGVYWAANNGVIGGVNNGDGTFSMEPTGNTWRCAAAKMLTVAMRSTL